ncbi:MAG: class I SAM-dependent methyltransferase [Methylobacter sp.]|nr:class I SAM-dependent methyltransferase [Methylobacter sp.]MDP2100505.1 class I SAM-dependent methyltransferase [Methylobacter sp.]MDP2428742.1 class I SAM-dependent methyltransferase [Methylobacter sp.]MDP3053242.1 class I SAM-dependent methyltransferase [Methylobacter sp.]MDP3361559.1 class I SAM-dependent methyltransferase [Methylobacter sp.]
MSDWTSGYVADIDYTYGYYTELNPLRVKLAFLNSGLVSPEIGSACELGFGQGLSANLHAAASFVQWHGTDFNPSQAGFAQELATVSGSGAKLYDDAFADFASRPDLPDFDYIGIHGIWSWISDDNRAVIVDFIKKKLKVGGVLYISYNTLPGWASFAPMRHLMTEHAEVLGAEGRGIISRIDGALDFAEKLIATNPLFARANPQVAERIQKIKGQNSHYLAHEYFNRDWHPMHFATMAECLEPAKLDYACSAHYLDHLDAVNLTAEQQNFLNEIPDPMFKQSVRDFMVNQQFRRDYWVKGARRLNTIEQAEALRKQKYLLITHRPDVSFKVTGSLGEATLTDTVYNPILDLLADHQPKTIAQVEQAVKDKGITLAQVVQAVVVLTGAGHLAGVQDGKVIAKVKAQTDKLNQTLMQKARGSNDISYLASPVTGGGVTVGRFDQLFLLALNEGKKQPTEQAQAVWQIISAQGQRLIKEGRTLESAEENIAELTAQAHTFAEKQLPILKALQIM